MVSVKSRVPVSDQIGEVDLNAWLASISDSYPEEQLEIIARACALAAKAHHGQSRASGEAYVGHVMTVADILVDLHMDYETVSAALLHDVVEDTSVELTEIERDFGLSTARLVDGVTKMSSLPQYRSAAGEGSVDAQHAESLRKMLLAMAEDVRVVLIKLADRLHNMRTLNFLPEYKQVRIAQETKDIYAPLANRLGIWQIKWELEDLSFRYLEPTTYKQIAQLLAERRLDRQQFIDEVVGRLTSELEQVGIKGEIQGRAKHIYSIWRKMRRKDVEFDKIFDVRAVRILLDNVAQCYAALGIVHSLWPPIHGEFDDYIATPKDNLYQSLHTAIYGPGGRVVEVQIRTHEMHEHSELGVAAHWRYKEGGKHNAAFEDRIAWMRQLLEWKDESDDAGDFIDRFKAEVFEDRVYVMTPMGKVMDLPQGATPLDFAYYVHTDIGHRCRGAKIDGHIVPLTHELTNGDSVEILTSKRGIPSRDWLSPHLGYLNTPRARAKVRSWFRHRDHDQNLVSGRALFDKELHRLGVEKFDKKSLLTRFNYHKFDDFLAAIGHGEISTAQLANAVDMPVQALPRQQPRHKRGHAKRLKSDEIWVQGVGDLLTQIAKCCKPVPKEPIVGYITQGRGVTIHRHDCSSLLRMQKSHQERLIEVSWGGDTRSSYPVDMLIIAYDRRGLLSDISMLLSNESINVNSVNTLTDRHDNMAHMTISMEISDLAQLSRVLDKIGQLRNVVEVKRRT
ncbi:MAG TPA: GTP diphosphokinase [Chromatiaceae bacterium]|jgi:GTP pyrophosphokinase|nr:GTP diphosphokinase [Chromatiaceae bacterium]HIB83983.1 GTP diphosphokinase [Chromatiaceae bacterium]HIN82618.1 GTP diphosphokinase [Chromatiales bacterium]HIO14082.1 GTP diphosphokinase [Chromatiales bacterium]